MNYASKKVLAKEPIILSLALLFCIQLYSQKKIFHGFYIGKAGDTVRGIFPNYTQWAKNPRTVQFIPSATSTNIELTPDNALKFYIQSYDTYLSYTGQRMTNPIEYDQAIANKDTFGFDQQYQPISTFLRLVAKTGNLEVYSLTDNIRTNYFYRLNNDTLQELRFRVYYDQNKVKEVNEYRQQLYTLFKDEMEKRKIAVDMEKIEYTDESLSGLLAQLTPVEKRRIKVKSPAAGVIIAGGVSMNFFRVSGDKTIAEAGGKYQASISPLLTVGYMSPVDRSFGRFFILPQLKLYNYKNKADATDGVFRKIITYKTNLIAAPVINVGANLVNEDNFKFFVSVGGGMLFLLDNKEQDETMAASNNNPYQTTEIKMSGLTYNANFSTGVTIKNKLIATAGYNVPVSVSNFVYYTPYHSSVQLTIGYKL